MKGSLNLADWQQQQAEAAAERDREIEQLRQQASVMAAFITKSNEFYDWLLFKDQWRNKTTGRKRTELEMVMAFLADETKGWS